MILLKRQRHGVTLVECLIAIAILVALALFSYAALQGLRRESATVRVQQSLRGMAAALMAYTSEHGGCLPSGAMGTLLRVGELQSQSGPAVAYWYNALDYYMGGNDHTLAGMRSSQRPLWQQDPTKIYTADTPKLLNGYGVAVGFGWNHQNFGYDAQPSNASLGWGSRLSEVEQPSKTIIIGTGEDSSNATNVARNFLIYANSIRCRRHNGGGYYLFVDGHVEHLTPERVMANNSALMKKRK